MIRNAYEKAQRMDRLPPRQKKKKKMKKGKNEGVHGIMINVVRNGHGDSSSNPEWGYLHFTALIPLGKVWIQWFSPLQ